MTSKLQQLIELHGALLEQNPYCYLELAYTKATGWMAWICTNHLEADPFRKVLARGQGESPEEAADAALESFPSAKHPDTEPVRRFRIGLCQKCGEFLEHGHECDAARKEVQP